MSTKWAQFVISVFLVGLGFCAWGVVTDDTTIMKWGVYTAVVPLIVVGVLGILKSD
ncbi:MAG: hypothetical protein ACE5K1_03355 [Acidiferrobacterales bacterium]